MTQDSSAAPIIYINNLTKTFGSFTALNKLDLVVAPGEVHGFLGPNGSGKSTTIRILLGLLKKSKGQVTVFGKDPWSDAVELHKRLAYVPGDVNLWPNLSGGEVIDLFADLRGGINKKRRDDLLEKFQLDARKKCRTYSKGNRQKVALVAALAGDAELYVFDEPTSGLDPLMEQIFQSEVKALKEQGKTILLSSHILSEVESLADRVTIIREGKTVESGTLADLRHLSRVSVHAHTKHAPLGFAKLKGLHDVRAKGHEIWFDADHDALGSAVTKLTEFGIVTITSEPPSLEELFMRHYRDKEA